MNLFSHLLGLDKEESSPELLAAIERAASRVDPLIKLAGGYPEHYEQCVATALQYGRALAARVPGPVTLDRSGFGNDPLVHALFPSMDSILEALSTSQSMRAYVRDHPIADEVYALIGVRRHEKQTLGMEMSGEFVQRDVPQRMVYFSSHTIEHPAPDEESSRRAVAESFFDSLLANVAARIEARKHEKQEQSLQKDMLMVRLHAATGPDRHALEQQLGELLSTMQATIDSLEPHHFLADFEAVLLHPEQYLRLEQTRMTLDSMGIRRDGNAENQGRQVIFNDLIGFDRRQWTVTLVHCRGLLDQPLSERLEAAYRKLVF